MSSRLRRAKEQSPLLLSGSNYAWLQRLRSCETPSRDIPCLSQLRSYVLQVQEQGELAIRIDENIDDTLANVDSAQAQLLKYLNNISSNRWLIMKVFFVLMLFLFIFIAFIA